jgi:predicted metal-dependent hydrolase
VTATAQTAFKDRVRHWAEKIGVRPARIQVQPMTRKWASCSPGGRLCFSTSLVREEPAFQEIVIVHELLHLRVPNHGRLFRSLMTAHLPHWERAAGRRLARFCRRSGNGAV